MLGPRRRSRDAAIEGAMNGIHDLGGMDGFGAVVRETAEPVLHAAWEGRVFALASLALAAGLWNVDAFRHAIERLPPLDYLRRGYYGRWLCALETLAAERGVVSAAEIESRLADPTARPVPPAARPSAPATLGARRERTAASRFRVGDRVRAANRHPTGHTRLPRYVRGRRGEVALVQPASWVLPDANAHGRGEEPQPVYAVRFAARELWGESADPGAFVHVDLFESYLEPAAAAAVGDGDGHG
jgi:nitrile hydratase